MKLRNTKNKSAFTLMEIGMGLLILSILLIVSIPIITQQAKKTDDYAYYLAYKTVEKMGIQIVAYGDPEGVELSTDDEDLGYFENNKNKFSIFADKIFKLMNPKAYALTNTSTIISFPSYEYDFARLCFGNTHVQRRGDEWSTIGNYFNPDNYKNTELCKNYYGKKEFVEKRFMCSNMSYASVASILASTNMTAEEYCKWVAQRCAGAYDCSSDKKACYREILGAQQMYYGECLITANDPDMDYSPSLPSNTTNTKISNSVSCDSYGYKSMNNSTNNDVFSCACDSAATPVKALNNANACCPQPPNENLYPYYVSNRSDSNKISSCINCRIDAFNEHLEKCCPENSHYNKSLLKCVCDEGYSPDNSDNLAACNIPSSAQGSNSCPLGSHLDSDNHCVANPPIVKAKRFCELVSYYWNVSSHDCDTFTESDGISTYSALYDAITADGTKYLSVVPVVGAFRDIKPNVVFANGLSMWILEDKSASIPGLSSNPQNYEKKINACHYLKDVTEESCNTQPEYYCKIDSRCFSIALSTDENAVNLQDARSCCSTVDLTDVANMYEAEDYIRDPRTYAVSGFTVFVDITGTKDNDELGGGGTLWKDVFPFYITSGGKVYPGYPLNAAKVGDNGKNKDSQSVYQGGNSSSISADVFYYDVVNGRRKKINVYPSIPYARALCFAMDLSPYTPYCQNLGSNYRTIGNNKVPASNVQDFIRSDQNPCYKHRCFVKLKNKIKFL